MESLLGVHVKTDDRQREIVRLSVVGCQLPVQAPTPSSAQVGWPEVRDRCLPGPVRRMILPV